MELIDRCRGGDQEAFGELFELYKNLVYRTALLMLDDADEADDVLQEVFLGLFRSPLSYQPEKSAFSTWLYRVTINRCLNRKRGLGLLELLREQMRWISGNGTVDFRGVEEKDCVRLALRRLSDPLRAVVVLRYYHGLSYAEIAAALAIRAGTVKSRLNQAHRMLSALLRADFPETIQLQEVTDEMPADS